MPKCAFLRIPLALGIVFTACCIFAAPPAATPAPAKDEASRVRIEVEGTWGDAPVENVQQLLNSVAGNLLRYCPERSLGTIVVRHHVGKPITLYKKGPQGEHQVLLNAQDKRWSQYGYQFAHELGHILCNYDHRQEGRNLWFEEALCETSSLFTLRKMAASWKTDPPYPNWSDFAPRHDEYVNALLASRDRRLPPDRTLPEWFREHAAALDQQRQLTPESLLVAGYLLPLLEDEPTGWEALASFNGGPHDDDIDFRPFIAGWKERAAQPERPFIEKIQRLFGVQ